MSLSENYIVTKTIGSGTFGKVKLAKHKLTNVKVAIKILSRNFIRSKKMTRTIRREIKILRLFRHPNIIRLFEVVKSPSTILLVTEYIPKGDLYTLLERRGRLSEAEARNYFQQIIAALQYIHKHNVAHRDIKPENLLLDEDQNLKLVDFGLSNLMREGEFLTTSCGSPNYAAPEVISGSKYCGTEVDIWSTGVLLFALVSGRLPFDDNCIPLLFKKIRNGHYSMHHSFSKELKDLVARMLDTNPVTRITANQIQHHPWYRVEPPLYKLVPEKSSNFMTLHKAKFSHKITEIDEEVLERSLACLSHLKKDKEELIQNILFRKQNEFTVCYEILLQEKFKSQLYFLKREKIQVKPLFLPNNDESTDSSFKGSRGQSYEELDREAQKLATPSNWKIGIGYHEDSEELMIKLFQAMKASNLEWKMREDFKVKARDKSSSLLRLEVKIYKEFQAYVLDFKLLSGLTLQLMDTCSKIYFLIACTY